MIWEYKDFEKIAEPDEGDPHFSYKKCIYCTSAMRRLGTRPGTFANLGKIGEWVSHEISIDVCDVCGWWALYHQKSMEEGSGYSWAVFGAIPVLRSAVLTDVSVPLDEIRKYLLARYSDRFNVPWRTVEELVGAVFLNLGCKVEVTAPSNDDGIDVIVLRNRNDQQIGVQVKRYKDRIGAEQIREFSGALLLNGIVEGIYVTMSDYTRGAKATARRYRDLALAGQGVSTKIKLWNAKQFYDAMKFGSRPSYETTEDPTAPFHQVWKTPEGLSVIATGGMGYE